MSVQFESVAGKKSIQDLIPGKDPVEFVWDDVTEDFPAKANATQLQIMNSVGNYDVYYYISNAYYGWEGDEEDPTYLYKEGWCDAYGTLATPELFASEDAVSDGLIPVGGSMWYVHPDATADEEVVASGAIIPDKDVSIDCPNRFRLHGNPYPAMFNINKTDLVQFSQITPVEFIWDDVTEDFPAKAHAPMLQVMNAVGNYDVYYYASNAYYGWEGDEEDPTYLYKEGWCDAYGTLATPELLESEDAVVDGNVPVSAGMWTTSQQENGVDPFKMKFISPLKK